MVLLPASLGSDSFIQRIQGLKNPAVGSGESGGRDAQKPLSDGLSLRWFLSPLTISLTPLTSSVIDPIGSWRGRASSREEPSGNPTGD